MRVIALLLAAVAVGLSNLAAAIGIGVTGVNARVRLQVGLVFGVFEAGMPIVGLLIGQRFATEMDKAVRWPGAILLMIVGVQWAGAVDPGGSQERGRGQAPPRYGQPRGRGPRCANPVGPPRYGGPRYGGPRCGEPRYGGPRYGEPR